jgi:hypothetical protein
MIINRITSNKKTLYEQINKKHANKEFGKEFREFNKNFNKNL